MLQNDLKIARALKEDAGDLLEYLNLIGGESDNLLFGANEFHMSIAEEEAFIEEISNSAASALFVAKIGSEIVSVANIAATPRKRLAHQATIGISVKQAYWNLGIATAMMQEIINFAKATKVIEIISLEVNATNTTAMHLYKKFGFVAIGRYDNFFKFSDDYYADAILMNLYL